jgi:hypothetical protein
MISTGMGRTESMSRLAIFALEKSKILARLHPMSTSQNGMAPDLQLREYP